MKNYVDDAFELAGYWTVKPFLQLNRKENNILMQQSSLGGLSPAVDPSYPHDGGYEEIVEYMMGNTSGAGFAALVHGEQKVESVTYPHYVTAEFFDFIFGVSGVIVIPYTPATMFTRMKISEPEVVGMLNRGNLVTNNAFMNVAKIGLLNGVLKNPDRKSSWSGRYVGAFMKDEINTK